MVTLYLSGDRVIALVGTVKGKKLTVQKLYVKQFDRPMISDRKIIDVEDYTKELGAFFKENNLPGNSVNLILTSNMFILKMVELPLMSDKDLMRYIPREFNDVENRKKPIYGCLPINTILKKETEEDKGKKYQHVFATMIERDTLDDVYRIARALKLKLKSITVNQSNLIRLMELMPQIKNNTCIVQIMQGSGMTNILYIDGTYTYSTTNRLFSEIDTPGYGVEIARSVSNIIQFMKAQQIDAQIKNVYVAGISPDTFTYVDEGICQINDDIVTDWISGEGVINWQVKDCELTDYIPMIAGFLTEQGPTSICKQYQKHSAHTQAIKNALRSWAAVIAVATLMLILLLIQFVKYVQVSGEVETAQSYLQDPNISSKQAQYDEQTALKELYDRKITYVQGVKEALYSYPLADSKVLEELSDSVGALASIEVTSFDANTGTLTMSLKSKDVADIHQLISNLLNNEMLTNVEYTGYTLTDDAWTVNVIFTLAASVGRE